MKVFLTAAEIAEAKLPGLPTTKRGVQVLAAREGWPSRARQGRGGGREYPASALPPAARAALAARAAAPAARAVPVKEEPPPVDPRSLAGWQRRALEARALILHHIEAAALAGGILAAEAEFARAAADGTLPPPLREALAIANQRRGLDRTISAVSLRRWRKEAHKNGNPCPVALAPKHAPAKGDYPWLPRLMQLYARPTKPSIAWCVEEMLRDGQPAPPLRTAQAAIARMGAVARRKGRLGARDLRRYRAYTARSIEDLEPLDAISADGHTFKAEVRHPLHGGLFRPEIVTVIDIATRRVTGWSAGLAESAFTVADALRSAASQGIAAILYSDNGCGFVNHYLDGPGLGVLARLGTTHYTAIAYNAQARGVIERLQAILWKREARTLPAYIGENMDREAKHLAYRRGRACRHRRQSFSDFRPCQ